MTFGNSIENFEIAVIVTFLLAYTLYVLRVVRIATQLTVPFFNVFWKLLLRFVYFSLLIISLLGPTYGEATKEIKSIGKDIYFCIDLSYSMNAFDIQPTRLEKLKFELKNIVEAFNSDRKGLIMFSNEAFMQCPLTYDNNALNLFIQTLTTDLVPNSGTDFGPALKMALEKFKKEKNPAGKRTSQIIILISDGEDFGEETEDIAKEIEKEGIKLFALGIGTENGSKIHDNQGFKRDNSGNEVVSKLNSISLKKIASNTGGKYFEINESNNDINRLINTINQIEGELRDVRKMDTKNNKYLYFLTLALFLMILDLLINIKLIRI